MYRLKIDKYILRITRPRKRAFLIAIVVASLLFISYQFKMHYAVSHQTEKPKSVSQILLRGTHPEEARFYSSADGKFTCIKSGEIIDFTKVNDDYCDCADSSDEPGTNACPNGIFYCTNWTSLNKRYPKHIPSSKVNDGICDCCDGSEELAVKSLLNNPMMVSCPNKC